MEVVVFEFVHVHVHVVYRSVSVGGCVCVCAVEFYILSEFIQTGDLRAFDIFAEISLRFT